MNVLKVVFFAALAGFAIDGIWELQDINWTLGSAVGLGLLAAAVAIAMNKTKKGNR